ncbi:MAG: nucleotidyltransferase family protein [Anaerolineales bacterium]
MDAILLAGGVPDPESPLYPFTLGKPKAALEIGSKIMIQWVLDALEGSPSIGSIVVVGAIELMDEVRSSKIVEHLPAGGDMLTNFQLGADAILAHDPSADRVAVVSSDIPFINPQCIEWVLNTSQEDDRDINYCVIRQERMEERFPTSNRSYVKLKDMKVCGGDLAVIHLDLYRSKPDFWRTLIEARKSPLHQASLIGFDVLLLILLRMLTLEETVRKVTRRLKITGKGLDCPYPEIGMDIDKPHQLEIARKELS